MDYITALDNFTKLDERLISDIVSNYANLTYKELLIKLHKIYGKDINTAHIFYLGCVIGEQARPAIAKDAINFNHYFLCKVNLN